MRQAYDYWQEQEVHERVVCVWISRHFQNAEVKKSFGDRVLMSSAKASAYTLMTPSTTCPTSRRSKASSLLWTYSMMASCRCTRARSPGQHERGSPSLLTPAWTTLSCGDSTATPVRHSFLRSSLASTFWAGCADITEPVACAACQSGILDTGATQNAVSPLLRAAASTYLGLWCIALFYVQVVCVGMYVCSAACYACIGAPQRRPNFDGLLKRCGKRQPQELVRHCLRTATRDSLSDYSLSTLPSRMTVSITAIFEADKCRKWTPTSTGVAGAWRCNNPQTCRGAYSAERVRWRAVRAPPVWR